MIKKWWARHLALASGSRRNEVAVEDVEDVVADVGQLGLNLDAIFLRKDDEGRDKAGLATETEP